MITQVSDKLYRGPRPDSMQPLLDLGITSVINLEVGYFEWFHHESGQESERAKAAGLEMTHYPFDDFWPPMNQKIMRALELVLLGSIHGRVYLHCLHGEDRTGIVSAVYRVTVQGWRLDDAITEMYALGFHKMPYLYLGWVNALREFCK